MPPAKKNPAQIELRQANQKNPPPLDLRQRETKPSKAQKTIIQLYYTPSQQPSEPSDFATI